jgi:hypothetical protein
MRIQMMVMGAIALAAASSSIGCSSSDSGSSGPYDFVTAYAERYARCNDGGALEESERTQAANQHTCYLGALVNPLTVEKCVTDRACGVNDDGCFQDSSRASLPAVSAYTDKCNARHTECDATTGFSDDWCGNGSIVTDGLLASMSSCLDSACEGINACFDAAFTAVGCKK